MDQCRKVFELDKIPVNAVPFCAATGFYEVFINGKCLAIMLNIPLAQYDYCMECHILSIKYFLEVFFVVF